LKIGHDGLGSMHGDGLDRTSQDAEDCQTDRCRGDPLRPVRRLVPPEPTASSVLLQEMSPARPP
jgi:hypothetical protein